MEEPPKTLASPRAFMRGAPAGFDGFMHWEWLQECWPNPRDKPMDVDAMKERKGQFLVIESKAEGKEIPGGQMIAFERLHDLGCFAIMFVWGKQKPTYGAFWFPGTPAKVEWKGVEEAQDLVRRWFQWADSVGKRYD